MFIQTDTSFCGQVVGCPQCGKGIVVPSTMGGPSATRLYSSNRRADQVPPQHANATRSASEFERMARVEGKRQRTVQAFEFVKGIVLLLLVVAIVWWAWTMFKKNFDTQPQGDMGGNSGVVSKETPATDKASAECATLHHYLRQQLQMLQMAKKRHSTELAELEAAAKTTQERIRELAEKTLNDKGSQPGVALDVLLQDAKVRELATKHAGLDFASMRLEFVEKMRAVLKDESAIAADLEKIRKEYEAEVIAAKRRADAKVGTVSGDVQSTRREVAALEKQLETLRKRGAVVTAQTQAVREWERRKELEERLRFLRARQASGAHSQSINQERERAENTLRSELSVAETRRRQKDEEVRRRTRSKISPEELANEFHGKTIGRLSAVIQEKADILREKLVRIDERLAYVSSADTGIDGLDVASLKRIRQETEKWLAEADQRDAKADAERERKKAR